MTGVRLTAWAEGRVQGVGFRWWVRSRALEFGLTGFAENLADGRVKVVAEGTETGCRDLLAQLESGLAGSTALGLGPPGRLSRVTHRWGDPSGDFPGFKER